MEEKLSKLVEFSDVIFKSDAELEPLQRLVEDELELTELTEMVPAILETETAPEILRCIFFGLTTQKLLSQRKRLSVIEKLVTELKLESESPDNAANILNIALPELDKLKTMCLSRLTVVCLDILRDPEKSEKTSWKEILPKIFTLLGDKRVISYGGSELTYTEFKREIIRTICRININPNTAIPLASMFSEIVLTSEEHEEVVEKLCEMFSVIETKQLPALVKQLLHLCKEEHVVLLFLKLRRYFSQFLCSNAEPDKEINDNLKKEMAEMQLAILIHIEEFAQISRLNDLIKLCKNASNSSCLLLDPFLLSILLILSCIPAYEVQITEVMRTLISQAVIEEERKKDSAWLCRIIDHHFNIDQLFSKTIQSRLCEHDRVVEGLVNLSFVLLAVPGVKSKESYTKKIWRIGRIVLVSLIKKHHRITKSVLQNLTDRIITGCVSQQYTDCLLHLCNVASVTMVDNASVVTRILEFIDAMPSIVSQRIVTALIPLVQISPNLRDNLIMCLRKALFSRNTEIRQTAVLGFLQLLKFLKLQRVSALSQNTLTQTTFFGPSVFTQICMDVHTQQTSSQQVRPPMNPNINEAICLEVVGILKRCFMQQVSVKTTLYKGLFSAICANPQLCPIVLDVLLDHFSQFYVSDVTALPPIHFEKTISVRNSEVTLQEPIGHLLLLVQDVLGKTRLISASIEDLDSEATRSLFKFIEILDSLVDRFSECDLHHFQLDEMSNISDTSCESMKTQEMIRQMLGVYEALIAYVINTWNKETTSETERKLIGLYEAHHRVIDFVHNSDKSTKKKDKDGTKDDSNGIDDDDTTTATTAEKRKRKSSKKDKSTGPKKCVFKIPPTFFNLRTINRLLSMFLLNDIEWSSTEAIQEIKLKPDFLRYAMNCASDLIQQIKVRLNEEQRSSAVFNDIVSLTKLIFHRCLSRYEEVSEFDKCTATTSVQCFSEIISLIILHYKSKFSQFLEESIFVETSEGLPRQLLPVLKVYKNLLKTVYVEDDTESGNNTEDFSDHVNKVMTPTLINAISTVVLALPTDHEITLKILDWLISVAEKHKFGTGNNCKIFMNLVLTMLRRCKDNLTVLDCLAIQLCHSFPSINECTQEPAMRPLKMVTDDAKIFVLPMTCASLISHLEDAEYMISRFKSENVILTYTQLDEDDSSTQDSILKRREKELCQHIMHITLMAENLISIAAPTGPCLELTLKFLTKTFSVLTALAKYFMLRSTAAEPVYQDALFHKLVKIAGSQFIRQEASELILYVEKDYENENKKTLSHLHNQAKKQFILLPKLVIELETFSKAVMQLSKKCKDVSLRNSVKLTITRDFRLNVQKVDELMSKQNESDMDEDEESTIGSPPLSSTRVGTQEPSQKRGTQEPSQKRGTQQPSQNRGTQQPSQNRGTQQPSQNRGTQQPSQKRMRTS